MTVKELRQGLRRGMFVYPFIGIHLLAVLAMWAEFHMQEVERSTGDFPFLMDLSLFMPGISGPFWAVTGAVCLLFMPLGGLVLMGQELEKGNHELLLMTPLSRWKVVGGKFFALWGLCLLTFSSLLPYLIARYLIGGIDVGRNIAMALMVVLCSAMMAAGTIGASSFRGIAARIVILLLFQGSILFSLSVVATAASFVTKGGGGILSNLNALAGALCYIVLGLSLARSRIRLVVHQYELKPSWLMIGLLIFTPFVALMSSFMTLGTAGGVGLIGMGLVGWFSDRSPKAPKSIQAPAPNIPGAPSPVPGGIPPPLPAPGSKGKTD